MHTARKVVDIVRITIDAHIHINGTQNEQEEIRKSLNLLFNEMDELNIQKAVLMPNSLEQSNEMISEVCMRHTERLIGFCWAEFNDNIPCWHIERFEKCIELLNFRGLKIHPRYQGVSIRDKRVEELVVKAGMYDVPVMFDCLPSRGRVPVAETLPLLVDELAFKHPKTKIIICHMGGHHALDAYAAAKNNENVYLDLSNSIIRYQGSSVIWDIEFLIRELAPKGKLIFGSDFPTYSIVETYKLYQDIFTRSKLLEQEVEGIMGYTMCKILKSNT